MTTRQWPAPHRVCSYAGPGGKASISRSAGEVRLDDRNRVTEFRLDVPEGCRGADGTVHDAARFVLVLDDFGLPALIEPLAAGPAVPI